MSKKAKIADLESSFKEINTVIEKMEHSELTLEQSLQHFEQGIILIKNCQKILSEAEQKVHMLVAQSNNPDNLEPYKPEENDE